MIAVRLAIFCWDAIGEYLRRNCSHSAGAIAFYTLFSMFPLFLFLTIGLTYVFGPETAQDEDKLIDAIAGIIPVSHSFIGDTIHNVTSARDEFAVVSVVGIIWASTAMFGAIRKGVNAAWGIRVARPFLKERLIDFGLVFAAGVLLMLFLFSAAVFEIVREITGRVAPEADPFSGLVWSLVPKLITPVLVFLTFLAMYRFLPNTQVRTRDVWPWALAGSLAFNAASLCFVWYVSAFPHYNVVYGSIGAVLALLTWVYLSATIVLFGALVCSRYCDYVDSIQSTDKSWKVLWGGFSRVRMRVVESPWAA